MTFTLRARLAAAMAGLVTVAALLGSPVTAAAQGAGGPPTEPTISVLRETLEVVMGIERQRQLLGLPPGADIAAAQLNLLTREFNENVLPGLQSVVDDCFFAEIPLQRAVEWSRQVQLLGFAEELGPLYEQARTAQDLTIEILKNCHDELYQSCVLNDSDPNLDVLGGLTRQLALFGVESGPKGSYQERWLRCEVGWHGTLTVTERVTASSRQQFPSAPGTSVTHTEDTGGNREVTIELPNRKQPSTGRAQGRIVQTSRQESITPNCRELLVNENETAAGGEGEASLRKGSDLAGTLLLSFSGPIETGYTKIGGRNESTCGGAGVLPTYEMPGPRGAWAGVLSENVGDPYAEVLVGTKTLRFEVGAGANPSVPGMGGGGMPSIPGLAGMPGMPGGPGMVVPSDGANPWLVGRVQPTMGELAGERPVVTMVITWDLRFG
ncbi:MAG TPA: hypothetical protein VFN74_16815 [Chloroflexota bacterium]|nr:hypothetical protein [Chloroflexota bacterium]